jgi:5'(3')-deoxyribonucleotidase
MSDATDPFVFGVDLDGVCADYTRGFRDFCAERLGVSPESLPLERSWDFREWGFDQAKFEELHLAAINEGRIFSTLEVIPGAAEALWRLSDAGVWIRIVTHRLYVNWGHSNAAGDTVAWLDEAKIPYRDLCFVGAKRDVGADAYIDDGPHNIKNLRAAGRTAIVFEQPYNRDIGGLRARTWEEVEEIVYDLMTEAGVVAEPSLPGFDPDPGRLDRRKE